MSSLIDGEITWLLSALHTRLSLHFKFKDPVGPSVFAEQTYPRRQGTPDVGTVVDVHLHGNEAVR